MGSFAAEMELDIVAVDDVAVAVAVAEDVAVAVAPVSVAAAPASVAVAPVLAEISPPSLSSISAARCSWRRRTRGCWVR